MKNYTETRLKGKPALNTPTSGLFDFSIAKNILIDISNTLNAILSTSELNPADNRISFYLDELLIEIKALKSFCNREKILKRESRQNFRLYFPREELLLFALSEICVLTEHVCERFSLYRQHNFRYSTDLKLLRKHLERYADFEFIRDRITFIFSSFGLLKEVNK